MIKVIKKYKHLRSVKGTKYSTKKDKKRQALHPGKRKSSSGKIYYERRRNRSDRDRRKRL